MDWLRRNERLVTIDAVILGEIRYGILLLAEGRRRTRLEGWCNGWSVYRGIRRRGCVGRSCWLAFAVSDAR